MWKNEIDIFQINTSVLPSTPTTSTKRTEWFRLVNTWHFTVKHRAPSDTISMYIHKQQVTISNFRFSFFLHFHFLFISIAAMLLLLCAGISIAAGEMETMKEDLMLRYVLQMFRSTFEKIEDWSRIKFNWFFGIENIFRIKEDLNHLMNTPSKSCGDCNELNG